MTFAQISTYCLLTVCPETSLSHWCSTSNHMSAAFSKGHDPITRARRARCLAHVESIFNECVSVIVIRYSHTSLCLFGALCVFLCEPFSVHPCQLCHAHFSGLVLSFFGRLTTESNVCFGLFPPLMRPAAQQHVENPSLGETVTAFDISIYSFRRMALATAQKCALLSLCCAFLTQFWQGSFHVVHSL